jgi:hypothetical protein
MDSTFEFASTVTIEDEESQRDSQFVFVTDHDSHYIRSYLMRASWTKRSRKKPRKQPEKRNILPAKNPEAPREEASDSTNRQFSIEERLVFGDQDAKDSSHKESHEQDMECSQSPKSRDIISSWEVANFDPFQTCPATVRPFEHLLIHHC